MTKTTRPTDRFWRAVFRVACVTAILCLRPPAIVPETLWVVAWFALLAGLWQHTVGQSRWLGMKFALAGAVICGCRYMPGLPGRMGLAGRVALACAFVLGVAGPAVLTTRSDQQNGQRAMSRAWWHSVVLLGIFVGILIVLRCS